MKYKVISFDMFQTLVDVTKRREFIWKEILGQEYSTEKSILGMNAIRNSYNSLYENAIHEHEFINMEELYTEAAKDMLKKLKFNICPEKVSYNIIKQHSNAPFYENTLNVLEDISYKYKIVICSDSNHLMIDKIIKKIDISNMFISDDMCCYKGDLQGKFFRQVLKKLNVDRSEILHVGDSDTDIIGTKKLGITNCLIKRKGSLYNNVSKADNQISDITELRKFLE